MMQDSKGEIFIGRDVSVDEQDISFQGRHRDKQGMTYKKLGDEFLVCTFCLD